MEKYYCIRDFIFIFDCLNSGVFPSVPFHQCISQLGSGVKGKMYNNLARRLLLAAASCHRPHPAGTQ